MREYELTVVLSPELDETTREASLTWLNEQLTLAGATADTTTVDMWGQRSLAYPIKDFTAGFYVHYLVTLDTEKTKDMERNMQFREELLRHLLIRKEE
jgi:small subunit ribosomal protein S6